MGPSQGSVCLEPEARAGFRFHSLPPLPGGSEAPSWLSRSGLLRSAHVVCSFNARTLAFGYSVSSSPAAQAVGLSTLCAAGFLLLPVGDSAICLRLQQRVGRRKKS